MINWDFYHEFDWADDKYLPTRGEGDTMASQTVTAIAKLVHKWYNDGDVFDNTHGMTGWCNDLSSYANWLYTNIPCADFYLRRIKDCKTYEQYAQLLADLTSAIETEEYLSELAKHEKVGSIYKCDGPYKFKVVDDEDDEDDEDRCVY